MYLYSMTVAESAQPWIMHGNFITATKQLMGCAFAQINSGITQCLHGLHVHVYSVCMHVPTHRFDCSSDGGGRQDENMRKPVQKWNLKPKVT